MKLAFWKKPSIDDELRSLELPSDSLKPLHDDPMRHSWDTGNDPLAPPGAGALPSMSMPPSSSGSSLGNSSYPQHSQGREPSPSYLGHQDNSFFSSAPSSGQGPGAQQSAYGSNSSPTDLIVLRKEVEVVSSKLDAIQSTLDSLSQRLKNLESMGEREQRNRRYW
ncbi:hypothetical protein COY28_03350 [Candidatus Woesearchaeota archaeon CG_4_10_14_0_2_um_filter_57_5]|nr:MAG: hypothetical protein AUJ68_05370 [Candidatus Woesearchaeota archaeon CG1_02_57_44]PIZ53712.1 MAG: hypothetical protein COY28_03350 [Candidatus Woesearchaeota archaeon CG_4_10_14_0_2_um_filter_57_5]